MGEKGKGGDGKRGRMILMNRICRQQAGVGAAAASMYDMNIVYLHQSEEGPWKNGWIEFVVIGSAKMGWDGVQGERRKGKENCRREIRRS